MTAHNRAQRRRLDGAAPGRTSRGTGPLYLYDEAQGRITFPNTAEDRASHIADRVLERARSHQHHLPAGYSGTNGSRWRGPRRPLDSYLDLAPSHEPKGLDADETRPEPLEMDQMKLDCECKICFGQIADTLLLPCNHLAICSVRFPIGGFSTIFRFSMLIRSISGVPTKWESDARLSPIPLTDSKSSVPSAEQMFHRRYALNSVDI